MKLIDIEPKSGFQVVAKTKRSEAATMVLDEGDQTGGPSNRHQGSDQWLYVTEGEGEAIVTNEKIPLKSGSLLLIEAGETHEIRNTGKGSLKTLNFYAPPEY